MNPLLMLGAFVDLPTDVYAFAYLVASIFFILGLKGLASPATARRGNLFGVVGMTIAIVVTLLHPSVKPEHMGWVIGGLLVGAAIGVPLALKIQMTSMPELVAALHSFVGLAAVLVGIGTYVSHTGNADEAAKIVKGIRDAVGMAEQMSTLSMIEIVVGVFIGAITFTGSVIAFGKLSGKMGSAPVVFKGQHALNLVIALAMIGLGVAFAMTHNVLFLYLMTAVAFVLGVTLIIPIGGADMPVIVSMLNSYSGWAAVATGFTLENNLLVVTGALVGSSGAILSYIMCKAMNRSFFNVVLGGFGTGEGGEAAGGAKPAGAYKSAAVEDAAYMMKNAAKIIIVPGYGMAVAQAQHAVREMSDLLLEHKIDVRFAIHPVAGRMPGHMNVLLAEADIPYDIVFELEEINSEFSDTDVVLVVGANDVVNPAAKTDKSSPIYGMPILDAYKSRLIYCIKRSTRPGYAGVDNELYFAPNCQMLFGDAKQVIEKLGAALKEG